MAERRGLRLRPSGMRTSLLGIALVVLLALAGCGDEGADSDGALEPVESPTAMVCSQRPSPPSTQVDLDGDGRTELVQYAATPVGGRCHDALLADVDGKELTAELNNELGVASRDMSTIQVPGRTGEVLLVTPQHPRGGFQAHLFGYADGAFEELLVDGEPIFGFVATDTNSSPLSASCVAGGFAVTEAVAHEPIGVMPAWDVFRTTYVVEGNTVTRGPREEVADNVLDAELESSYRDLVRHRLFEDCRADRR